MSSRAIAGLRRQRQEHAILAPIPVSVADQSYDGDDSEDDTKTKSVAFVALMDDIEDETEENEEITADSQNYDEKLNPIPTVSRFKGLPPKIEPETNEVDLDQLLSEFDGTSSRFYNQNALEASLRSKFLF
jgi:hypothetical protein